MKLLFQSSEVANSNAMELEGLKRSMARLQENSIEVSDFTTDRHPQVKKYMREKHPTVNHWFDVWHVAKGNHWTNVSWQILFWRLLQKQKMSDSFKYSVYSKQQTGVFSRFAYSVHVYEPCHEKACFLGFAIRYMYMYESYLPAQRQRLAVVRSP